MFLSKSLSSLISKLETSDRNTKFFVLKEMQKGVEQATESDIKRIINYTEIINDIELISKLLTYLAACIASNAEHRHVIARSTQLYDKAFTILSKNLPSQNRLVLNFLTALVCLEENDVYSAESKLANYARGIVRVSGCLRTMSQMFLGNIMYADTWRALCLCLSECCRGCRLNQNQCSHIIPVCIEKILRESDWDMVSIVLQSILEGNPENCESFFKHRGLRLFNMNLLQRSEILQVLNTIIQAQTPALLLISQSDVPKILNDMIEVHGKDSELSQWCSVCLFNLTKKGQSSGELENSNNFNVNNGSEDMGAVSVLHNRIKYNAIAQKPLQNCEAKLNLSKKHNCNSHYKIGQHSININDNNIDDIGTYNTLAEANISRSTGLANIEQSVIDQLVTDLPVVSRINENLKQLALQTRANKDIMMESAQPNAKMRALYRRLKEIEQSKVNFRNSNTSLSSISLHDNYYRGRSQNIGTDNFTPIFSETKNKRSNNNTNATEIKENHKMPFQERYLRDSNDFSMHKLEYLDNNLECHEGVQQRPRDENYSNRGQYLNSNKENIFCIQTDESLRNITKYDSNKSIMTDKGCQTSFEETTGNKSFFSIGKQSFSKFIPVAQSTPKHRQNISDEINKKVNSKIKRKRLAEEIKKDKESRTTSLNTTKGLSEIRKHNKKFKSRKTIKEERKGSLKDRLIRTFNDSITSIIDSVKTYISPKTRENVSATLSNTLKTSQLRTSSVQPEHSFSFTEYFNAKERLYKISNEKDKTEVILTESMDSEESKSNNILNKVEACKTCNDTTLLRNKLSDNHYLQETVKKLKLGLNLYGCNFSKIAAVYWPKEKFMTPSVLYTLYNKLILK